LLAFAGGKRFLGGGKIEIDLKALQTVLLQGFAGTNEPTNSSIDIAFLSLRTKR